MGHEKKPYSEYNGDYIWREQICDQNFENYNDIPNGEFYKFLQLSIHGGPEMVKYALSCLGYMLHTYKIKSNARMIYVCDHKGPDHDGNADGGTGKNIYLHAVELVRNTLKIDGKNFDRRDKFKFQRVNQDHQVVNIDDYEGNITEFFNVITGDFEIERKGMSAVSIPFMKSPKVVTSSNNYPNLRGESYRRRVEVVLFGDYFNSNRTPFVEFGHDLFGPKWEQQEWDYMFSLMVYACQLYLNFGIKKTNIDYQSIEESNLLKQTSDEFVQFMTTKELNEGIEQKTFRHEFEQFTGNICDQRTFGKWLRAYAATYKLELKKYVRHGVSFIKFEPKKK